jgi:hypothetical protein
MYKLSPSFHDAGVSDTPICRLTHTMLRALSTLRCSARRCFMDTVDSLLLSVQQRTKSTESAHNAPCSIRTLGGRRQLHFHTTRGPTNVANHARPQVRADCIPLGRLARRGIWFVPAVFLPRFVGWRNKGMQRPLIGADVVLLWLLLIQILTGRQRKCGVLRARTFGSGGVFARK